LIDLEYGVSKAEIVLSEKIVGHIIAFISVIQKKATCDLKLRRKIVIAFKIKVNTNLPIV